eukprot:2165752-Amphidinium_carterae.3
MAFNTIENEASALNCLIDIRIPMPDAPLEYHQLTNVSEVYGGGHMAHGPDCTAVGPLHQSLVHVEVPDHEDEAGMFVLFFKQSRAEHVRQWALVQCTPLIVYSRRAEDLSIKLIPDVAAIQYSGCQCLATLYLLPIPWQSMQRR